jgi:putative aldouronate transport system substrate-binding protein
MMMQIKSFLPGHWHPRVPSVPKESLPLAVSTVTIEKEEPFMRRLHATAAILILSLALALSGCGQTTTTPAAAQESTPAPVAASASAESNSADASPAEESPEALPPATLRWFMMLGGAQRDQDEVFAAFSDLVESKINAKVEIVPLEWGTYDQKLQMAAASGEEFDLAWISDWMGVKYADFANRGAIIPLDDLIATYAPKTKALVADKFWDTLRVDGSIYGVPCYQIFYRQNGMWVRKDLADKYGFQPDSFKTYKDLEPFYDNVLANETDVTPLAVNGGYMWWFANGTGPIPDHGPRRQLGYGYTVYADKPETIIDELTDSPDKEDFDATVRAARDWYQKKYVRQDLLSIQDNSAEVKSGRYASGFTMMKPAVEVEFKDANGFEVYAIPLGKPILSGVTATELAISVTSTQPERAMMLIELLMNDVDVFNLIANGMEGKHYVKSGETRISRVENNGYQPNMNWALGNTLLAYLVPGQPDDLVEQVKRNNEAAEPAFMPDWSFNNENVKNETAAMDALWNEFGNPLVAGALEPDTSLPEYRDKMGKAGHDKLTAEMKTQFEAYLGAK